MTDDHNALLRTARERLPSRSAPGGSMSRAELAEAVNTWLWIQTSRRYDLDDHLIGKWERGKVRWPIPPYRAALRAVLGAESDAALGFSPPTRGLRVGTPPADEPWTRGTIVRESASALAWDLLNRRDAVRDAAVVGGASLLGPLMRWLDPITAEVSSARSGAFASTEVEALEHLVDAFRQWRSAGLGRTAVVGQLSDVSERLQTAPDGPLTSRVFLVAAELAKIAASMAFDAGAHHVARRYYVTSARLAKAGGDMPLGAVALGALARMSFDLGAAEDGLAVVHLAQRGTRSVATPRLRALLSTREAWGHAQLGDVYRFRSAVDTAADAHARSAESTEPSWLRSLDEAELAGTIGARYRDLARHEPRHAVHAIEYISRALVLRDPHRARNRAFDLVSLGRAHLLLGEPDHAAAAVLDALPHLDPHRPGRLGRKIAEWHREAAPFAAVATIAQVRDRTRRREQTSRSH